MTFMHKDQQLKLFKMMLASRAADKREAMLIRQGKAHVHVSSSGHEALMVVPFLLEQEDYLYPYYRGCHLMTAKGLSRKAIARDFLAKATSSSQGRSMAAHCGSAEHRIFPSAAPTASQCLPAVGTAWGQKLSGLNQITVCSIGDGSTREGEFYEAVCYAVQEKLPIIFLVEDNQYAISTTTANMLPFRLDIFAANLFIKLDGRQVLGIYEAAKTAIAKARAGDGPTILWCEVDRLDSHTAGDDHKLYRLTDELENLQDPIKLYSESLLETGVLTPHAFEQLWESAQEEVKLIYKEVMLEPEPSPINLKAHLYGEPIAHQPLQLSALPNTVLTMVDAVNFALNLGLNANPNTLVFGQDIADPKGGVFGFTKGLSTKYPSRVLNAPISEATIIGTAVGLAALGYRPVFEIQFIDFITPGFDQLVSQVASLRWRSCGAWVCPMVLYAPYGAYLPAGGLWHSQSNDGWWTHIPGLRVAIPSTPQDTLGLFWAAMQDPDPSLILIPKHIFRIKETITDIRPITFGKARIVQAGTDVTVIGWGNTLELIQQAAQQLAEQNISLEIIDLRTLVPCDWETLSQSLVKTGRLVVVQEANKTSSFGPTLITHLTASCFDHLYSSPRLVARDDVHIPYHPDLEYAVLPSVKDVSQAILRVLE
jgi:2-oxoisovalerate dehydrogenase E1 component